VLEQSSRGPPQRKATVSSAKVTRGARGSRGPGPARRRRGRRCRGRRARRARPRARSAPRAGRSPPWTPRGSRRAAPAFCCRSLGLYAVFWRRTSDAASQASAASRTRSSHAPLSGDASSSAKRCTRAPQPATAARAAAKAPRSAGGTFASAAWICPSRSRYLRTTSAARALSQP
jgi:hypothetical protein